MTIFQTQDMLYMFHTIWKMREIQILQKVILMFSGNMLFCYIGVILMKQFEIFICNQFQECTYLHTMTWQHTTQCNSLKRIKYKFSMHFLTIQISHAAFEKSWIDVFTWNRISSSFKNSLPMVWQPYLIVYWIKYFIWNPRHSFSHT